MYKHLFIIMLLLLPVIASGQDEITVEMTVSSTKISIDDQLYLTVKVSGSQQNLPQPQLPSMAMFEAYSQGTSTNISIVNGQVESSLSYNYLLIPKKEGTFVIKPAAVVYNHKRYESNEVSIQVVGSGGTASNPEEIEMTTGSGQSRDLFLIAEVDKKRAYVNEQITLTIKFFHAVKLMSQPDYTAPQTTDFWADLLEEQKTYYQVVNGRRYKVIEINTALFPTRSGDLQVGSAMVEVRVPSRRSGRRSPFSMFDDIFTQGELATVRSRSIDIKVLPLPSEGKPENFTGTVGKYTFTATPDKTTVDVNQPVTVTYKFSGTGNITTVAEPQIGDLKDFRIYQASSDEKVSKVGGVIGGTKVFEEVYIPKRAGQLTIPPVEFNYFNPATKKYYTHTSKPIVLTVNAVEGEEYADLPYRPVAGRVVDPKARDIRFIKTNADDLRLKQPLIILRPQYFIINLIPILILAFVWISRRRKEKLRADIGYARSRQAKKMAKKRLGMASKLAKSGRPAEFFAEIRLAIFSYVADKLNISPHGMTGDYLLDIIKKSGAGEELVERTAGLLKNADFAQYSSASVTEDKIMKSLKDAEETLVELEGINLE
ncbi:MAG TPA: protein BatD [candidate division Zixibacteria bacterium]|nr:protein BatD [candidate division Zixibacteria bacterium]